jgi:hypothetical protein
VIQPDRQPPENDPGVTRQEHRRQEAEIPRGQAAVSAANRDQDRQRLADLDAEVRRARAAVRAANWELLRQRLADPGIAGLALLASAVALLAALIVAWQLKSIDIPGIRDDSLPILGDTPTQSRTATTVTNVAPEAGAAHSSATRERDVGPRPSARSKPSVSKAYAEPIRVLRQYWKRIATGNYSAAYSAYYPGFGLSRSQFIQAENDAKPTIALKTLKVAARSQKGKLVTLNVRLVLRDRTGQYAGQCRLLSGWVRFQRYGARWYYRPGAIGGVEPDFAKHPRVLAADDPRCP